MSERLILHEDPISGNCYKIRLTAALLGVPLERRTYDITKSETRTPQFLAEINANGRIPVLQIGDRFLTESNAAAFYLADGSSLVPDDRFSRADMLRWMFFEQYQHEPNIATLRYWLRILGEYALSAEQKALIPAKRAGGEAALALIDAHLDSRRWLVGDSPSLADICLFAYTHVADESGFDLAARGNILRWLADVARLPGFVAMSR